MIMPMSADEHLRIVPPESRASKAANSRPCCLTRSTTCSRCCARSRPRMRGHGPSSNARRAAATAASASGRPPFATVAKGGRPDADAAVAAARRAFDEGPWPRMRGRERAQHLLQVVDLVKQHGRELAALEARDSGGTIRKCSSADIGMIINTFRFFAELAARESDEEPLPRTSSPPSHNYMRREPIGVCVGITPWNFPVQMAAWKIAPAIAAGNTVVLKPSPYASLTTLELGRLCLEAGLPEGVVNVVTGTGVLVGEALVSSPQVDKVAFTGSTSV